MGLIQQAYTLSQAIERHGKSAELWRPGKGQYGSPGVPEKVTDLQGLFHTSSGYLDITMQDSGKLTNHKQPMFLIMHSEYPKKSDTLKISGHTFTVNTVDDVGMLGICMDLSLTEVDES
ncbi:MAG: hypothetical protein LKJ50_05485 [Clostridiales bacterium]|jgi:hypothetical protein|nr:hypothetical protein [Clostridiales bacterium]MCI1961760.1 hypothetical protein [Clostridiales bacterium]MCI2021831.1 hypothetical protein [Clostridiales bacterium]MCI2026154.1 hypothetical protein [Clostridiales bacterium]